MGDHLAAGNGEFTPVEHEDQRAQAFGVVSASPLVLDAMGGKKSDKGQKEKEHHGSRLENGGT